MSKVVIKVGSNLLVKQTGEIDKSYIIELARVISGLKEKGNTCILITSGAKAAGYGKAQKENIEEDLYIKQALCAIGQVQLMKLYELAFDMYDEKVAQILINRDDFGHRERFLNLRNTLIGLNEMGFIPIANENDTVSTNEITFGDNDILAAMTAIGWKSDYLLLLSSVEGLLDDKGKLIKMFSSELYEGFKLLRIFQEVLDLLFNTFLQLIHLLSKILTLFFFIEFFTHKIPPNKNGIL